METLIHCIILPEYPGDVAHDLGVVSEPLGHVCEDGVALQGGEGLPASLAVQGVPETGCHLGNNSIEIKTLLPFEKKPGCPKTMIMTTV